MSRNRQPVDEDELEEREFIAQSSKKRFRGETEIDANRGSNAAGGDGDGDGGNESSNPEDAIPDLPENQAAREFLRKAPRRGLHMPLGAEVKVMQCWRCKAYGHRSGDRECPMRDSGNDAIEGQRRFREDPMSSFSISAAASATASIAQQQPQSDIYQYVAPDDEARIQRRIEKYARVEQLMALLQEIRVEEQQRKERKQQRREERKQRRALRKQEKHLKKQLKVLQRQADSCDQRTTAP